MRASSIVVRILSLFIVFLLGFFTCVGALVGGGYIAFNRLSLDKLGVNTDSFLSKDAEVDLSALSFAGLIAEISSLDKNNLTIELLMNRYGLILPEDVDELLNDDVRQMKLNKLFSKEGVESLLSDLYIGKIFGYERIENPAYDPENPDAEPETVWVKAGTEERVGGINGVLADISISELLDSGIPTQKIMDELTVGELMELTEKSGLPAYIEEEDGTLTLAEDIEPISIWYDADGNEVSSVIGALANKSVSELTTELDDIGLGELLGTVSYNEKTYTYELKRTSTEFFVLNEAESVIGEFSDLSIDGLTGDQVTDKVNNLEISTLLGYEWDEANGRWLDKDGKTVNAVMEKLADSKVGNINETVDTLSFGDISGIVPVDENGDVIDDVEGYDGEIFWYKKGYEKGSSENEEANGLMASLAHLSVKDMSDEKSLSDAVKDTTVGDAMGYFKKDGVWYTDDTCEEEANGMMASIADSTVGEMTDRVDEITFREVAELVAVDENGDVIEDPDTFVGEIRWYEKGYEKGSSENVEAAGIMIALAGLTLSDMRDDESLTDAVGDVIVGDALGFVRSEDAHGKEIWLTKDKDAHGNRKPAEGIVAVIANYKVNELNEKMKEVTLGDVSDLVSREEPDPLDPSKTVTVWYTDDTFTEKAGGVTGALANLTVADMSDDAALTREIKKVTVGDALGYVPVEEDGKTVWYEKYVEEDSPENKKVVGIMKHVAGLKVGEMSTEVEEITFADISGMEKAYYLKATDAPIPADEVENYSESEIYFVWMNGTGEPASGLMAGLAHLKVADFNDETKVSDAVKDLTVGDAMGYEKVDGVWYTEYDPDDTKANRLEGLVKAIADEKVGVMDEMAKKVTLAEVSNLIAVDGAGEVIEDVDVESYEGVWYEEYYGVGDPKNKPTTGLMAGLAHLTLEDLQDSDEVRIAVGGVAAGHAMGYEKVGDTWYTEYDPADKDANRLTGLVKAIADSKVENLNEDIQTMKFGTVAGLTYDEDAHVWMDGLNEAKGINAALADLTVGQMSDTAALSNAVQKVTVADAMNYTKNEDGEWVDEEEDTVTGFMAVIAEERISGIREKLDDTEIGEFMGYKKNAENGDKWEKNGVVADSLMQKVCSKKMNGLDGLLDELQLQDVVENRTGLLSFVDEETKVTELDEAFEELFTDEAHGITIGELVDADLINIELHDNIDPNWTFAEFMKKANEAISLLPPTP